MTEFTFEIVRQGERPVIAKVMTLADDRAIWCQVEALALQIKNGDGALIRVRNPEGEIVVRTGVVTALASIEKCSCTRCPLKKGSNDISQIVIARGSSFRPISFPAEVEATAPAT